MTRAAQKIALLVALIAALAFVLACGGDSMSGSPVTASVGNAIARGPALLRVRLTDAPVDADEVNVTIDEISAHRTGGPFFTVLDTPFDVDLLTLTDAEIDVGGVVEVEPGKYTQVRLHVSAGTVVIDGEEHELTVPSEVIKIINGWDVPAGTLTTITLDFDAAESLHLVETGGSDPKYILRPVIKIVDVEFEVIPDCPMASSTPADGDTDVGAGTTIDIDLPGDFEPAATDVVSVEDSSATAVDGTESFTAPTLTFTPDAALAAGETYTVTVDVAAIVGNPDCDPLVFSFTTAP